MPITDNAICKIATQFRVAIEAARDANCFTRDLVFWNFPRGCCGDACDMLAEHLRRRGVKTIYVCGDDNGQSHAWLVVKDERIQEPKKRTYSLPDDIHSILSMYTGSEIPKETDITGYEEQDLQDGLIIDITADQFGEAPVYIGTIDDFHRQYEFVSASEHTHISDMRLSDLYKAISRFL